MQSYEIKLTKINKNRLYCIITGEYTREELNKDGRLSWTDKAAEEILTAKGGTSSAPSGDGTTGNGSTGGDNGGGTNTGNITPGGNTGGDNGGDNGGGDDNGGGSGNGPDED